MEANKEQENSMAAGALIIKTTTCMLLVVLAFSSIKAQDQTMIQLKALDHQLNPYPGLSLVLNDGKANQVDGQGVSFVEVNADELPPAKVKVLDPMLEVESWNFSKGILEVVLRPRSYQQITATVLDQNNQPMSGIKVVYKTQKPISAVSNPQGKLTMNLPVGHDPNRTKLFQVDGYQLNEIKFKDNEGILRLVPVPLRTTNTPSSTSTIANPSADLENLNFDAFNYDYLDSIQSLTVFYAVIKNVDVNQLDQQLKRKLDEKFYQLVSKWEDSLINIREQRFMGSITDSSLVESDVSLLIDQALQEQQSLTIIRNQFDDNVALLQEKLAGGGTNLSKEEQLQILQGINRLSQILGENERKFYQNQAQFNRLLNVLRSRLTSIDELEEKLLLSERQLALQNKEFTQKLFTAIGIALVLAILGIISLVITKKFQKQKNALAKANNEVIRVNEHLEELVSDRTAQLQETNQELDTFLYKSSHDLRRPLTSILGLSNLAHMTLGGEASELFDRAAETARGMDRMLQKLINVNEINNPSHYKPIDFTAQVQKSFDNFEDMIADRNIMVKSDIEADIRYSSFPELIDIILLNLIENALFFSSIEQSNGRPSVDIQITKQNGHVTINLEDNGCGIDSNIKDKIWNMFFVGHERSTGNGLGLYIARKAVKTLQGEIRLKSNATGNTVFEVKLPTNGA